MAYDNVAINFGSPRSGTTAMRRMLGALHDTYATKLHEHNPLHPCESDDGLLTISHWMLKDAVVFVRTVRHPLHIVDSFLATRTATMSDRNPSLACHSDERVERFIRSESEGVAAQREALEVMPKAEGREHYLIEVRYEDLESEDYRDWFADEVYRRLSTDAARHDSLRRRLHEEWGRRPTRDGKLNRGWDWVMDGETEARWTERLADVIEREGYA